MVKKKDNPYADPMDKDKILSHKAIKREIKKEKNVNIEDMFDHNFKPGCGMEVAVAKKKKCKCKDKLFQSFQKNTSANPTFYKYERV